MRTPTQEPDGSIRSRVSQTLRDEFGIETSRLDRIHAGTATGNFTATTSGGARWFVKVRSER
ncbi:hypothetical protein [Isoptericola sp. NPDC057391]|uniref:hypothetical protein n=1 Tax=Isoptericola sp. NPDC057391 TaxID=3346117 RepID=UPI003632D3B3